jgi:hypothetical protein
MVVVQTKASVSDKRVLHSQVLFPFFCKEELFSLAVSKFP